MSIFLVHKSVDGKVGLLVLRDIGGHNDWSWCSMVGESQLFINIGSQAVCRQLKDTNLRMRDRECKLMRSSPYGDTVWYMHR